MTAYATKRASCALAPKNIVSVKSACVLSFAVILVF